MNGRVLALAILMSSVASAVQAAPITYTSSSAVGTNGFADLSITTDGTIGNITASNITSYTIKLTDTHGSFTLTPSNSGTAIGGGLTASLTSLMFNFSGSGYALFQNPAPASGMNFLCFAGTLCGVYSNAENLLVGSNLNEVSTTPRTGVQIIANVALMTAAAPEPATWAMMIVGFGVAGYALRRRRFAFKDALATA